MDITSRQETEYRVVLKLNNVELSHLRILLSEPCHWSSVADDMRAQLLRSLPNPDGVTDAQR